MKKILISILYMGLLLGCGEKKEEKIKIGITQIVEHESLTDVRNGIEDYLKNSEFADKIEYIYQNAQGEFSTAQLIAEKFDKECDIAVPITTPSAQAMVNAVKTKPVIYSAVANPKLAGVFGKNITGVSNEEAYEEQVKLIGEVLPNCKKIGLVYNTSEVNSTYSTKRFEEIAKAKGYKVVVRGITTVSEMGQALDSLLPEVDMLFTGKDNMLASTYPLIIEKSTKMNKPVIGGAKIYVEQGAIASVGASDYQTGYETGELIERYLKGEKIEDIKPKSVKKVEKELDKEKILKFNPDFK